jgi:hypothetical protein
MADVCVLERQYRRTNAACLGAEAGGHQARGAAPGEQAVQFGPDWL